MMIPFLSFSDDKLWTILEALEDSLTLSEIANKTGLEKYTISRKLSEIKSGKTNIRLRFEVNLEKIGFINVGVIGRKKIEILPFLQSYREVRLLGRKMYLYTFLIPYDEDPLNEVFSNFEEDALTVRGLERKWWRVDSPATAYTDKTVYGKLDDVELKRENPPTLPSRDAGLDDVDVLLLWGKYRWPFTSMREIERESEKYLGRRISHQVLSWHFKRHFLKLWIGNRVWLYGDIEQMPYRLLYLEGRDSPYAARALVQLPWFHTAYIDFDKALVSGQPPCPSMPQLYKSLGDLDVDVVDFYMEPSTLKWVPLFDILKRSLKKEEVTS